MTVQKELTKNIYVGNGQTTKFPFTFECPDNHPEYIRAYVNGKNNKLTETTNFSVDMTNKAITYPANGEPLAADEQLVIMRELPVRQLMNLVNNGPFFAEDIETAFDEGIMIAQQSSEKLGRALVAPPGSTTFDPQIPIVPGKTFRVSDDGTHLQATEDPGKVIDEAKRLFDETAANAETAKKSAEEIKKIYDSGGLTPITDLAGSIGTALKRWGYIFANKVFAMNLPIVYKSVAEMKADVLLSAGMTTCTLGYYSPNDGGAGTYIIRAKDESDVDDGGSLHELTNGNVAELVVENGTVCPEQFGAKGDNTEKILNDIDVTVNGFHAAISYCKEHDIVFTAPGKYILNASLTFDNVNCDITGIITSKITEGFAVNIVNSQRRTLKFYVIDSSASGIRLYGETEYSCNNKIEWHTVRTQKIGFEISGVQPNYDNTIVYTWIRADDICFNVRVDSNKGFITETRVFAGNNGGNKNRQCNCILKMIGLDREGETYLSTFYFYNLQLENCIKAMYLENINACMFYNPRTAELDDNAIELTGWTARITIVTPIIRFHLFYLHDFKYDSLALNHINQPVPVVVYGLLMNKGGNCFAPSRGQLSWVFNTDGTVVFPNPVGYIKNDSVKWDLTYLKNNRSTITDPPAHISITGGNVVEIDEHFYQKNKAIIRVSISEVSENNVATIKIGGKTFEFKERHSSYELKNIVKLYTDEWVLEKVTYF